MLCDFLKERREKRKIKQKQCNEKQRKRNKDEINKIKKTMITENPTDKRVPWCDCLLFGKQTKAIFSIAETVKTDDMDCCKLCGNVVCFSVKPPGFDHGLEQYAYQKEVDLTKEDDYKVSDWIEITT